MGSYEDETRNLTGRCVQQILFSIFLIIRPILEYKVPMFA